MKVTRQLGVWIWQLPFKRILVSTPAGICSTFWKRDSKRLALCGSNSPETAHATHMESVELVKTIALLVAVIDPLGTVPVFIAVTRRHSAEDRTKIAIRATIIAAVILLFFLAAGQFVLDAIEVPLDAFQISGGIILFLFALSMIFGESKTEQEVNLVRSHQETATFPLAVPSIASPGAIMAVMVLTDNHRFSVPHQVGVALITLGVLGITLLLMLASRWIIRVIGDSGASIISRIMGLLIASVAANSVLGGLKHYFPTV